MASLKDLLPPPELIHTKEGIYGAIKLLSGRGDWVNLLPFLDAWLKKNPNDYEILTNLAVCYQEMGKIDKAIALNQQIV